MSFIPRDPNSSQTHKIRIERQATESSSNNESFKSTPKGSPDLSNFTPKDNNNEIKIKSFVAASGSEDFLTYSDDSENNLQKRVKVSTPLQIMKKSQQDFPEKRHKHHSHHNKQNDNSNKLKSPKSKTNPKNNVQSRDINLNNKQPGDENDNRNHFAEYDDQSPQMLSSSSVQTGEEKQNEEHEVLMKPRNRSGMKKPKLIDVETQVKYHIVQKNKTPDHKTETVQTRNADQFEIDFDDNMDDRRNSNSRKEDKINAVKQRDIELKDIDKRKSPKHSDANNKDYDKEDDGKKSPKRHHHRKSPRRQDEYENDDYDRRKSPRHHHSHDRRKSPRHRYEYDRDYDRRKSPRHRDEYDRDFDRRKSPRYRDEYESEDYDRHRSPRHRYEHDRDYDRQRSSRYSRDYDDNEYDRRKSPRNRYDDREYDRHRSSRYSREYEDDEYSKDSVKQVQPISNNQQDLSSSNSIDRLADSIQPNTMTIRNVPLDEIEPPESPTKATQTIENDVFERDFNLPENEVDECGEGLRFLSTIFNSSSSAIIPNDDAAPFTTYQQRVNGSIEKARALQELASQKPPKLADISIQIDMTDDEMQEDLLSSSFDKRLQEVDFEYDNDLVKERNVNLKFIQQKQELSEDSDNNNSHNESFNFILSENDEDENKHNQAPAQKVPSRVRLSTENVDLSKYSSKASFRSKSGDLTIAPNFTEDSYSSIQQPPESEKNLMPLSEGLQAIEASVDQTKTKETLSAAMSSIDLYTEIEEEEEDNDQDQNTNSNKYSFGDQVKERGFGQIKLNNQSDSSKKSQRSEANPNSLTNENSFSEMSDIPKSPRTHESMLSNEKLLSHSSNSNESHHSNKSNQSYQSTKSNQSNQSHQSSKSNQSKQSNQSHQSTKSNQSHQSEKSNKSQQKENSIQSNQSQQSNQSHHTNKSNQSNHSNNKQQTGDAQKSAFSLIYSEQDTDEMNKQANRRSPFTYKNRPLTSSDRIDPNSASISSAKQNINSQTPTKNRNISLNNDNNRSGFSSQSFSHSPPINDDVFEEEEEEVNSTVSEKSVNIFLKNKDIQLTPSEESSLIHDFPGDSVNKEEKPKSDFPIKSSSPQQKSSSRESSKIDKNDEFLESNSLSNIEFVKNRNINIRQSDESSLINDFPGDTYKLDDTEKKNKKTNKQTNNNNQLNFPRVSSESNNKINSKTDQSPKIKPKSPKENQKSPKENQKSPKENSKSPKENLKSPKENSKSPKDKLKSPKENLKSPKDKTKSPKEKENSIRSEIIQLQASDYSENSKPVFNLEGSNSENISKKLRSLKIQNSSSLSSSLYKNAQNQQRKEEAHDTQSYESNGSNKKKNKTFQPITLNQLSSESDSFNNNKLQNKNENKVLQLNDLDDNSSISDNFNNNSSKRKANTNNINRLNQQKNCFNDNDEKASSSNEEKE